jgi:asparagine synthase (glutamine-hydrolysing)
MCGIAGIIGLADKQLITAMNDAQAHRGPDDAGAVVLNDDRVALGHRRLSIIDLSPAGHQPMANQDETLWITFNGEIYNYREIREELVARGFRFRSESDTEVLLAAYEAWGERCLDRLNGMFAFAVYDRTNKRLFAARDRLGIKPLYYCCADDLFIFASEIKAIFACPQVEKRPDFRALCTPARFQVSPRTGFENILKLPPGHFLIHQNGVLKVQKYWDLAIEESLDGGDHEVLEHLDLLIRDATRLQMIADVPVGAFLSGGLDSSLISALMREATDQDIHAFTIRFSEVDQKQEKMPDDSHYARKVAQRFGFKYHEFEISPDLNDLLPKLIWHLDEPLSDPAAINTYLMSRAAREQGIVVLLNGMGGDEIFGGYRKHLACLHAERYQRVVPRQVRTAAEKMSSFLPVATESRGFRYLRWIKRFLAFGSLPQFERYLASDLALSKGQFESLMRCGNYEESVYYKTQKSSYDRCNTQFLTKMCANDTRFFLPEHNLTYTDKATMAAGVESRPPLTDHRIAEYMFSLAPRFRIRGTEQKYALKKVAERYLSADIVYRPKASFGSPLRSWIRGDLAAMVGDVLSESSMRARQLFDTRAVSRLIERDRRGLEDNSLVIWTILTTELWYRMHFNRG